MTAADMTREEALGMILLVLVQLDEAELRELAAHARVLVRDHKPTPMPKPKVVNTEPERSGY